MDDLVVEVRRTAGIYLKAKIVDVLQDSVVVELDNNAHTRKEFSFSEVRFPSKPSTGKVEYTEGEQIEVLQVVESEDCAECWVNGRVHLVKGEFVVAVFDVNGVKPQDIFPSDRVRRPNRNASITSESIHRHIIPIPSDLVAICQDVSNHKEFMQTCGASFIHYSPKLSALVILSCNEVVIKKAVLLTDMHLKSLRQKCALVQMMKDASKKLEQSTRHHHHPTAPYHDDFVVCKELMGLAIGSHGNNIQQAKQLPGIKGIELDENTGTFTIYGDSQKAVAAARSLLEFKKETINLPKNFISRVIGRNGHHIQDIVDRSGVLRVKIKNDEYPEEQQSNNETSVPFIFVGTADSINNAKLLLNYQVNHLKEVEQLTMQKRQLDAQLRDLSINSSSREQFPPRYSKYPRESDAERENHRGGGGGRGARGQRGRPGYHGNRGQGQWMVGHQEAEYQDINPIDNRYGDQAQRGHYSDHRYHGDDMRGRGSARGRHNQPYGGGGKQSSSPQQAIYSSEEMKKGGGGGGDVMSKEERGGEQMANGQ